MSAEEVTSSIWSRDLTCYKDSDDSKTVCGKCGRPICEDHHRSLHDSTFYHYEDGSKRAVAVIVGLLAVPVLFVQLFPNLISGLIREVYGRPVFFTDAIVHSAVILALALGLTLRFQLGERRGDFRLLVRQTAERDLCDDCYEDTFLQRALYYGLILFALILVLVGLRGIFTQATLLPLRIIATGVGVWILRDDVVAYVMYTLGADERSIAEDTSETRESHVSTSSLTESDSMSPETNQSGDS